MTKIIAEYIWLDGQKTQEIRSKLRVLDIPENLNLQAREKYVKTWGFDGSSTKQAEGKNSDCVLNPVRIYADPIRGGNHIIILNEVGLPDESVHPTNSRARLRASAEQHKHKEFWFGIEQEYTMLQQNGKPLGFPQDGFPAPQGPYYCGNGANKVFGRELAEEHLLACIEADIEIGGVNAEVMPGQWEYQVGPKGGALKVADDLIVARYLMERIGEKHNITITLDPKPVKGDWNGTGGHVNFSTKSMREIGNLETIAAKFESTHDEHIKVYGTGNDQRLTGAHETCGINEFKYGVSDRGASIRIPWQCAIDGKGYLEDRRPAGNLDPYKVIDRIIRTVCE